MNDGKKVHEPILAKYVSQAWKGGGPKMFKHWCINILYEVWILTEQGHKWSGQMDGQIDQQMEKHILKLH